MNPAPQNTTASALSGPHAAAAPSFAAIHDSTEPPALPLELIESILLHVPLRFPLQSIKNYFFASYAATMHANCAAALTVVSPPPSAYKVFIPRMPNALHKLMQHKDRFGIKDLQMLLRAPLSWCEFGCAFSAAVEHNRVDVLEWWAEVAKQKVSNLGGSVDWDDSPIRLAVRAEAWDSLDWLARGRYSEMCDDGLTDEELADLVRTGGKRQVQFVAMWLQAGYVVEDVHDVIEAACEMGCVEVLQGWADGHEVSFEPDEMDEMCVAAVNGRGPTVPVLEWMLDNGWDMSDLEEYASEAGNLEALKWWEDKQP